MGMQTKSEDLRRSLICFEIEGGDPDEKLASTVRAIESMSREVRWEPWLELKGNATLRYLNGDVEHASSCR